jgi:predicted N-acetyltransferase YhbS
MFTDRATRLSAAEPRFAAGGPEYRRQGIGRELMHRALALAPGGRLFFGAQFGNEGFFERIGFVRDSRPKQPRERA